MKTVELTFYDVEEYPVFMATTESQVTILAVCKDGVIREGVYHSCIKHYKNPEVSIKGKGKQFTHWAFMPKWG